MPKRAAASRPAQNCLQQAYEHLLRAFHWLDGSGTSWLADAACVRFLDRRLSATYCTQTNSKCEAGFKR